MFFLKGVMKGASKFAITFALLTGFAIFFQAQDSIAKSRRQFRAPVLGHVDKVELFRIDDSGQDVGPVNGKRVIEGRAAEKIARIWRKQKFVGRSTAACHNPPYSIEFYSRGKVVLSGSVCWACSNVYFGVPKRKFMVKFLADSPEGQLLYETFKKVFSSGQSIRNLSDEEKGLILASLLRKAISEYQTKTAIESIYVSTENVSAKLIPNEINGVRIHVLSPEEMRAEDKIVYFSVRSFKVNDSMVEVLFGRGWKIPSGHSGYDGNYYDYSEVGGEWVGTKTDEVYFENSWGPSTPTKNQIPRSR